MKGVLTEMWKSSTAAAAYKGATTKRTGRRILVVEDDLELTTVLDRILKNIDSTLITDWVTSAEQAIALIEDSPDYDLILADIFLEGPGTGLDLWKICQQHLPDVPLVVTSGLSVDKFFTTLGRDTIAPPFLPKPFLAGECKQLLEGMLSYSL